MLSGIVAVEKPKGMLSNTVVTLVKKLLKGAKVGHGGTLDGPATGVVVLGIGDHCKALSTFLSCDKGYLAEGILGTQTDTDDATGEIIKSCGAEHVRIEDIQNSLPRFRGNILQSPPIFSALKLNGQRYSDLARSGKVVQPAARPVVAHELQLTSFNPPSFNVTIKSSGGFYVRSLIRDIGAAVGSCAHMKSLIRTQQGPFLLESASTDRKAVPFAIWGQEDTQKAAQAIIAGLQAHTRLLETTPNLNDAHLKSVIISTPSSKVSKSYSRR